MMIGNPNLYACLKARAILDILDGDAKFGQYDFKNGTSVDVAMPRLSGPNICGIARIFGLDMTYSSMSRWEYLDDTIDHCIKQNKMSDLLVYLFRKEQFSESLGGRSPQEIDEAYTCIIDTVLKKINEHLYFGGNELCVIGNQYIVKPIDSVVIIEAPKLKTIDREYIKSIYSRALDDIKQNNFDSAITKARTLLEEVFCYVIELKGEKPSDKGNIGKLYKRVRELYNMHTDPNADKRINELLSGLNNIVSSIAEMRNKDSDAHGVGASRINVRDYYARLCVNVSIAMAEFIVSVANRAMKEG